MSGDLVDVFLLSLAAAFNPALLAAVTVMMWLPGPKRLMLGYLLGAYATSITLGLVAVVALPGSSATSTAKHTLGPLEDVAVGLVVLAIAFVLGTGRDPPWRERRRKRKDAKLKAKEKAGEPTESLLLRMLGKGDPRVTFVVGAVLSFPGVFYLDALDHIHKLDPGTGPAELLVVGFCVIQQALLELPLLSYVFAPDWTKETVTGFRAWMGREGLTVTVIAAAVIGVWLVIRGVITLS